MRGRGGWYARGYGMGWGRGAFGRGPGGGNGYRWPGNPYPYCRNFPWLPRGWWWTGAYRTGLPWSGTVRWPAGYPYPVNQYYQQQAHA